MVRDNRKRSEVLPSSSTDTVDLRRDEAPTGAEQGPFLAPDPEVNPKGKRRILTRSGRTVRRIKLW